MRERAETKSRFYVERLVARERGKMHAHVSTLALDTDSEI